MSEPPIHCEIKGRNAARIGFFAIAGSFFVGAILIYIDSRFEIPVEPLFIIILLAVIFGLIFALNGYIQLKNTKRFKFERTLSGFAIFLVAATIVAAIVVPCSLHVNRALLYNQPRGEANAIAMAVKQYYNDYGLMPGSVDGDTAPKSRSIIRVLIANDTTVNPRKTVYLETETSLVDGTHLDRWGTQYRIYLDGDDDGKIHFRGGAYLTRCIVVSAGPDRRFETPDDIATVNL